MAIADSRYIGRIQNASVRDAYENAVHILERIPPTAANRKDLLTETGRVHQRLGAYFTGALEHDPARALQHHLAAERMPKSAPPSIRTTPSPNETSPTNW